jgi:hypothetical protein
MTHISSRWPVRLAPRLRIARPRRAAAWFLLQDVESEDTMRLSIFLTATMIAAATLSVGRVDAGKRAGVEMPDTITVGGATLALNGMGIRKATIFNVKVYVAGLYLEHVSSNPNAIIAADETKRLVLLFVRNVGRDDIVNAWNEGFERNATVPVAQLRPFIDQLDAWMPAFHSGDALTFTYVPGEGVTVEVNGARKGVIANADFARSLFAIWLGQKPPGSALKRDLLGDHPATSAS